MGLMINLYLKQEERDQILAGLTNRQRDFLNNNLKRGIKTVFANILAKEKAGSREGKDIDEIANEWEFLDYKDAGPNWKATEELSCECGRLLRYQYTIKNNQTGEIQKFGINHFEEHTGIPPQLAREIARGIEEIDYELDEILIKIMNHWTLQEEGINEIPSSIICPHDIQEHFDYDIPLLNRQVLRLKSMIKVFLEEQRRKQLRKSVLEQEKAEKTKRQKYANMQQSIRMKTHSFIRNQKDFNLKESYQLGIMVYLYDLSSQKFRTSDVCEHLVKYHGANSSRFSSGKYKIFPDVCMFLEHLESKGIIDLIKVKGNMDHVYTILNVEL